MNGTVAPKGEAGTGVGSGSTPHSTPRDTDSGMIGAPLEGTVRMRKCDTCGITLPLTNENFPHNKSRADGFSSRCHVCNRQAVSGWVADNRSRVNRRQKLRYWERRKEGLHRITKVVNGKSVTTWARKPAAAPVAPAPPAPPAEAAA